MTDNEVKTPNKRKSLAAPTPGKKAKLENGAVFTPSKKAFNKNTPKQKSPKPNQKPGNKNASPKQVKPFEGTAKLQDKKKNKKADNEAAGDKQVAGEGKKKRKSQFHNIVELIRSDDPSKKQEGLKKIENKIKTIESRPEQTKTSKRKLNWLRTQKNILEGKPAPAKVQEKTNLKSESQKRRERKKKGDKNAAVKQEKPAKGGKKQKQQPVKKDESDEDEESSEEEEDTNEVAAEDSSSGEEEQEVEAASDEESGEEEAEEESGDEEDDDDDNEEQGDDSDEESEEEAPKLVTPKDQKPDFKTKPPKRESPSKPQKTNSKSPEVTPQKISSESPEVKPLKPQKIKEKKDVSLDDLKRKDLISKNQKRFVLFVGNIPYDTTKQDLIGHFSKAGEIMHVRIPLEQKSNKPRGFAYLELTNEETYQKCLSMHHSFMKNRRLNVLYTQGGKKKGDDKKKEIKAKNMKLHAMRKQGQLAGSVKESNKRSFRRAKQRNFSNKEGESNE